MITATSLVDLLQRFVLLDDETVEWRKDRPEGPSVDVETTDRMFTVRVVRGLLRIEDAPWVEAVVAADREDQEVEGPPPEELFLVLSGGDAVHLRDPAAVAALGERLPAGELDAVAFAEVLVRCQWPGGWSKRLVADPVAWRGGFPALAPLPEVAAPAVQKLDGEVRMTFAGSRETSAAAGGRPVLDVARWSVRAPLGGPVTWDREPVAEAVPLAPPW